MYYNTNHMVVTLHVHLFLADRSAPVIECYKCVLTLVFLAHVAIVVVCIDKFDVGP